jgi:hypothetical protein
MAQPPKPSNGDLHKPITPTPDPFRRHKAGVHGAEKRPGSDAEKQDDYNGENAVGNYKTQFPDVNEREIMMKIDSRVIPVLCILYLLAYLDRCVQFLRWRFRFSFA